MTEQKSEIQDDELDLKNLVIKLKGFGQEIWAKKLWVVLVGCLFALLVGFKTMVQVPEYEATLSFLIEDKSSGGMAGISGLLGSFGFGGSKGGHNLDKMLYMSKSRKISKNAFFKEVKLKGENKLLANHIIQHFKDSDQWYPIPFYKFWQEESTLKNFQFTHDSIENFSNLENLALKVIQARTLGKNGAMRSGYDDKTGIINFSTSLADPKLAITLTEVLFEALSQYYVAQATEKHSLTYNILKSKSDSVTYELRKNEYALADHLDTKRNLYQSKDKLREVRLKGKIKMGYAGLAAITESLEMSDFALKSNTPLIQVIDRPVMPLFANKGSTVSAARNGFILGVILSIAFIIMRRIFRLVMA